MKEVTNQLLYDRGRDLMRYYSTGVVEGSAASGKTLHDVKAMSIDVFLRYDDVQSSRELRCLLLILYVRLSLPELVLVKRCLFISSVRCSEFNDGVCSTGCTVDHGVFCRYL